MMLSLLFEFNRHHRDLLSFPTRRSSDLWRRSKGRQKASARDAADGAGRTAGARNAAARNAAGTARRASGARSRSEEHTSELQSLRHLVCRLLLEKKK